MNCQSRPSSSLIVFLCFSRFWNKQIKKFATVFKLRREYNSLLFKGQHREKEIGWSYLSCFCDITIRKWSNKDYFHTSFSSHSHIFFFTLCLSIFYVVVISDYATPDAMRPGIICGPREQVTFFLVTVFLIPAFVAPNAGRPTKRDLSLNITPNKEFLTSGNVSERISFIRLWVFFPLTNCLNVSRLASRKSILQKW